MSSALCIRNRTRVGREEFAVFFRYEEGTHSAWSVPSSLRHRRSARRREFLAATTAGPQKKSSDRKGKQVRGYYGSHLIAILFSTSGGVFISKQFAADVFSTCRTSSTFKE